MFAFIVFNIIFAEQLIKYNMRADELMIGNYVAFLSPISGKHVVDKVHLEYFKDGALKNVKVIPLTEDWLLKFGFEKIGTKNIQYKKDIDSVYALIMSKFNCWIGYIDNDTNDIQLRDVSTVHQLQNLYFALTQKELEIK